jgi:hypothetical protein
MPRVIDDNLIFVGKLRLDNTQLAADYDFGAQWVGATYGASDRVLITVEVQAVRYSLAGVATSSSTPIAAGTSRWFCLDTPSREVFHMIRDAAGAIVHCEFFKHRT